ncbi:uncharacterized protein B0T15DRAFT_6246 [Chaetomium strumarium]|uniref:Uncharacterized protein n=1 Tax=Chaetomium strumarium TaxID=1170767 RepID=A0AAJ0H119_9PEZI|nr:hypothetical protein B0T15DRAFT_6246 [Chaetomium strumarium]
MPEMASSHNLNRNAPDGRSACMRKSQLCAFGPNLSSDCTCTLLGMCIQTSCRLGIRSLMHELVRSRLAPFDEREGLDLRHASAGSCFTSCRSLLPVELLHVGPAMLLVPACLFLFVCSTGTAVQLTTHPGSPASPAAPPGVPSATEKQLDLTRRHAAAALSGHLSFHTVTSYESTSLARAMARRPMSISPATCSSPEKERMLLAQSSLQTLKPRPVFVDARCR